MMTVAPLVAPRPVRIGATIHLPFFLANALGARSPVSPQAFVGPSGPSPQAPLLLDADSIGPRASTNSQIISEAESLAQELTIEDLAARIRLDDEAPAVPSTSMRHPSTSNSSGVNVGVEESRVRMEATHARSRAASKDADSVLLVLVCYFLDNPQSHPVSRSPEAALDEFLAILRPVIRAPSSPIARSKRLVPRSRHAHHHPGLHVSTSGPERHHPYARSAKSTSPLIATDGSSPEYSSVIVSSSSKRASGGVSARSPTSGVIGRRRSSNANDSSYSCGSASISSSRSQSVSRKGSDGYLNAWTSAAAATPPVSALSADFNANMEDVFDTPDAGVDAPFFLSGNSPHGSSPAQD